MKVRSVLYYLLLLCLVSCQEGTKETKSKQIVSSAQDSRIKFDNFYFLDSIKKNNIVAIWPDQEHLYDSMFVRTNLPTDTMRSEVIRMDTFDKQNSRYIAVLVATRTIDWECHPCGPLLEVYSFSFSAGKEKRFIRRSPIDRFGSFGYPPEKVSFCKIGENAFGYRIESGFTNGGENISAIFLYELTDDLSVTKILEIEPSSDDNVGMFPEDSPRSFSYETRINFQDSVGTYFPIKAMKKGTVLIDDKIINIDSTFYFQYRNKRYDLIKTDVNEENTNSK